MNARSKIAVALLLTLSTEAASAQDLLIRAAQVHTVSTQGTLDPADVLIHNGTIAAVGARLPAPAGATIVEARGRPLTPGLFGGLSAIGLKEISAEAQTVDAKLTLGAPAWQQQWRPEFDVTLAYNPRSTLVPIARMEGVTWTELAPSSNDSLLAGQGAAVTLDGRYDAVLAGSRSLFVNLGSDASALSGGSRAAQYMLLDQAIREVRTPNAGAEGALLHAAGREALGRYLAGGRVLFHVERAADIRQAIAFARRNGLKPVIVGGSEGWLVAKELARADVPVLLDPLENLPGDFDHLGARLDNAALLERAGVRIAFSEGDGHLAGRVRQLAGNAVAHGLPWPAALAALTANPAQIFGMGTVRGRIAPGQVADLVLWSGDPLEVTALAQQVWIAGRPIDMHSRQTALRDRYLKPESPTANSAPRQP